MHGNGESQIADCELKTGAAISDQATGEQQSAIRNPQSAVRLCLHAWKLAFHHPASGEWLEFATQDPDEIAATVAAFNRPSDATSLR